MSGLRETLLGIERVEVDDLRTWWAGIARDRVAPAQAARWARDRPLLEVAGRARGARRDRARAHFGLQA